MQLAAREKQWLIAAAVAVGLTAAYHLGVQPVTRRVATLERVLGLKRETLAELRRKSSEYASLQAKLAGMRKQIAAQPGDFRILSFLENAGKLSGLSKHVASMDASASTAGDTYVATRVSVKLEGVTLSQITRFLVELQKGRVLLGVRALEIRRSRKQPELLDAELQVAMLARKRPSQRQPADRGRDARP